MGLPYPTAVERFPRLRQSTLSDFDNCALTSHFALQFEAGWSSHPAARGQIIHRTIARCLEELEENDVGRSGHDPDRGIVPVDVALEVYEQVIRQEAAAMRSENREESDQVVNLPLREIAQGRVSLKALFANQVFSVEHFAGIEKRLDAVVAYPDENGEAVERVVTGRLDLLEIDDSGENATVVDWKDTFGIPSEGRRGRAQFDEDDEGYLPDTKLSEEGYFQQRFYALLIFHHYPRVQRVTLREFYIRYASGKAKDRSTGKPINPVREATIDRFALPEIEAEMRALVERFDRAQETGHFTPSPGSHCSYCARPNKCPILPEARVEGQIASQDHAELIAGRVQVVAGYLRSARASLKRWSNWHGDVPIKDAKRPRVYGPVVRLEERKPTAREITEAIRRGQDPAELYTTKEVVKFAVHTPDEEHPFARAAREEEEMLLAAEKAEGR